MKKILSAMLVLSFSFLLIGCKEENPTTMIPDDLKKTVANLESELNGKSVWTSDDPVWGNENAPISMVVFSDFQCPFCGEFFLTLERLENDWITTGKLKIQHRDFPLSMHFNSIPAHMAANAAALQGKYMEMHRVLFEKQNEWESATNPKKFFQDYAELIGLDPERFEKESAASSLATEIQNDKKDGKSAGVSGTPGFFINGVSYDGALSYEQLVEVLEKIE